MVVRKGQDSYITVCFLYKAQTRIHLLDWVFWVNLTWVLGPHSEILWNTDKSSIQLLKYTTAVAKLNLTLDQIYLNYY